MDRLGRRLKLRCARLKSDGHNRDSNHQIELRWSLRGLRGHRELPSRRPLFVFRWVETASTAECCPIPPHEIVHAACHRRSDVNGWVCRRSGRDTNRSHALLRAVPECGQGVIWSNPKPVHFRPHARESIRASVIGFRDVEPPHFVLQRCALQPETLRSRSRTRDSSRRRF